MTQINFKDLSWVCKTGVVGGWLLVIVYVGAFIIGFASGLT